MFEGTTKKEIAVMESCGIMNTKKGGPVFESFIDQTRSVIEIWMYSRLVEAEENECGVDDIDEVSGVSPAEFHSLLDTLSRVPDACVAPLFDSIESIREEVGASEWEAGDCDVAVLGDEISEQISVLFSCIESVVSAVPETALSKAS